ncbi:AbiH family protein [Eupransor demetentiae]
MDNNEELKDTLLVIGNGYDLAAGLGSSYSDFYKSEEFKKFPSIWKEIIPAPRDKSTTEDRWGEKPENWRDVETAIENVLIGEKNNGLVNLSYEDYIGYLDKLNQICNSLTDEEDVLVNGKSGLFLSDISPKIMQALQENFNGETDKISQLEYKRLFEKLKSCSEQEKTFILIFFSCFRDSHQTFGHSFDDLQSDFVQYIMPSILNLKGKDTKTSEANKIRVDIANHFIKIFPFYIKALLDELRSLENSFESFLINQCENPFYMSYQLANWPLKKLVNPDKLHGVLDFNYTQLGSIEGKVKVRHIHGSLSNHDIIFGIDSHEYVDDDNDHSKYQFDSSLLLPFTKNSRKFRIKPTGNFKINDQIKTIIFFGHSLGDADFSYFRYLFDEVNLYDSDCTIIFNYSVYNDSKRLLIENDIFQAVEHLMRKYQSTLETRKERVNLIDKLEFEQRIRIEEVKL